ncbi:disulfide bond formation protein B [Massilia cavernae]|uniref:Disulfide bond formation protein B n=1 Tax=Massilia cavernae TaxID=2320864 RepID=A0A418XTC9_9BURK|nr:disulfide bond formation protein B [Massilia cavernae]RJG15923.1 disulfide bond formation protein B [Massilia cavernae]
MPNNRTLFLAVAFACFALIGVALYLQHVKDMLPCPLCVFQRYAFLGAGVFALVAAFAKKPTIWAGLALASTVGGMVAVGKHLYVLANPGFSCGIDPMQTFLNKIPTAEFMPWLFFADGLCEESSDAVLGLSIPAWSAVWFVIVGAVLLFALVRRR